MPNNKKSMMKEPCPVCGRQIIRQGWNVIFCSSKCSAKNSREKYIKKNGTLLNLSSSTAGALNEILVAADLFKKRFHVFRAISPVGPCDLVILNEKTILRIEVTAGIRSLNGKLNYPSHSHNAHIFDIIAVVERNGIITYIPELPLIG